MAKRLGGEDWKNIFRNVAEVGEDVETVYLDNTDPKVTEWGLHCGDELFEDGFSSEAEADARLEEVRQKYE